MTHQKILSTNQSGQREKKVPQKNQRKKKKSPVQELIFTSIYQGQVHTHTLKKVASF